MNPCRVASYNVDIAKRMGLLTASLISYISRERDRAILHRSLNKNGTFSVYRNDIFEDTGLSVDEQSAVESSLGKIGILEVSPFRDEINRVYYKFNDDVLYAVMGRTVNHSPVTSIVDSVDSPSVRAKRLTSRERSMNDAKRAVKETDSGLRQMWIDWIDAVYERKFTLTPAAVVLNEKQLERFDSAKKEEILQNAIKNGYRDISWSIKACSAIDKDAVPTNWKSYESMQPTCNTEISGESF